MKHHLEDSLERMYKSWKRLLQEDNDFAQIQCEEMLECAILFKNRILDFNVVAKEFGREPVEMPPIIDFVIKEALSDRKEKNEP